MASDSRKGEPLIVAKDLWKAYGNHQVLRSLSLTVNRGETVVILGRSGVGKSVLLRQIIGLDRPDHGSVAVDGYVINSLKEKELYHAIKHMGMLFQGAALFDSMTVGDNVGFYLLQHPDPWLGRRLTSKELDTRVAEALAMVDLPGIQNKLPSELSGGQRKRAALARLIAYRPTLILYDEPTTGLDPITSMHINDLIVRTQKELNATSIVVTHDIRSAIEVGDRLALHSEGVIAHIAEKEAFVNIDDPLIRSFFKNVMIPHHLIPSER